MHASEAALQHLARAHRSRTRPSTGHFPGNGGALLAVAKFRAEALRFTVYATTSRLLFEVGGVNQQLCFAVNRPEAHRRDARVVGELDDLRVYGYARSAPDRVTAWLAAPYHVALIRALQLDAEGYLRVYVNGLRLSLEPASAVPAVVERIGALVRTLPRAAVDDLLEGVESLPPELQPLSRLFERWAVDDDALRSERLAHARKRDLAALQRAVEPHLRAIDAYLSGLGNGQWPLAAVRLGQLAEAVAELRARDA